LSLLPSFLIGRIEGHARRPPRGFLVARAAVWRHCAGTPHRCLPLGWARRDFRSTDCAVPMVGNRLRPETLAPVACSSPLGHPTTPFQHPTTPFQLVVGAHSVSCAHRVPRRHGATLAHTHLLCIRCRAPVCAHRLREVVRRPHRLWHTAYVGQGCALAT